MNPDLMIDYHKPSAPLCLILYVVAFAFLVTAWICRQVPPVFMSVIGLHLTKPLQVASILPFTESGSGMSVDGWAARSKNETTGCKNG